MTTPNSKRLFGSALVGCGIQKTIADTTTYRLRRGNGQHGAILGELYQDKYPYNVSDPTASHCPAAAKTCFANAVVAWQGLSAGAKKIFNDLAGHVLHLSGYNLYIRQYMYDNY